MVSSPNNLWGQISKGKAKNCSPSRATAKFFNASIGNLDLKLLGELYYSVLLKSPVGLIYAFSALLYHYGLPPASLVNNRRENPLATRRFKCSFHWSDVLRFVNSLLKMAELRGSTTINIGDCFAKTSSSIKPVRLSFPYFLMYSEEIDRVAWVFG